MQRLAFSALVGFTLIVGLIAFSAPAAVADTAVSKGPALLLLVRHAEEGTEPADDPGLTDVGKRRAQDLAMALRDAGVTTIITSPFRRAGETAAPLAAARGFKSMVVPIGRRVEGHVAAVAAAVRGLKGVVLVVGHSNTVPEIIAQLGGPTLPDICASVYDTLFTVVMADGKTSLVRGRYGAPNAKSDPNCRQ
jgi:phosphohistidine phosphatase SixA